MKRRQFLSGAAFAAAAPALLGTRDAFAQAAQPQPLRAGTVRVAILQEMVNFDPMQFSTNNFPLIKNLYDSLIEYSPEGRPIPSLATAWAIAAVRSS